MKKTVFAIGFLLAVGPASAAVLNVKADGTGGYPTIQAAVTAAVSSDIVELENGIYTGAGNISLDPSFCDAESWDFHLLDGSPCAPFSEQNPTCDLAGAWPVGRVATPTQNTSWGQLKTIFR